MLDGRCDKKFHLALMGFIIFFVGCASSFNPRPVDEVPFKERAQIQSEDGVTVTAAVLSAEECRAKFGVNLYSRNIQPIWLEIENNDDEPVRFLPMGLDPNYFTPLESSYLSRGSIRKSNYSEMNLYFYKHGMDNYIGPGKTHSGFVYTIPDEGTKTFNVDIVGEDKHLRSFTFFIPVPGIRIDHQRVDWETLYPADKIVDYDETGLRKALEGLPCCTANKKLRDGT